MSLEDRPPFSPPPAKRRRPQFAGEAEQPFLSGLIIAACFALYAWEASRPGGSFVEPVHPGMLYGPAVRHGQWFRLITHVFEHGGPLHLLLNMSAVLSLGTAFERIVGRGIFGLVSFTAAMGSAAFSLLFSFDVYMLGASGMILGWAGAILPILTVEARRAFISRLVPVAIISLMPGVSWQAHAGGFLFGLGCGFALKQGRASFAVLAPLLAIAAVGAALAAAYLVPSVR
jgi:membrane associated rhomboid family serine protease